MEIREATEAELDRVSKILELAWSAYDVGPDAPPERQKSFGEYKASVPDVRSRLAESTLLVAIDDGAILGTVTYYPPTQAHDATDRWPAKHASFRFLGVDPAARGRGIGRILTDACIRLARDQGATHLALHTHEMMSVAKAMYLRMGFEYFTEYNFNVDDDFVVEAFRMAL